MSSKIDAEALKRFVQSVNNFAKTGWGSSEANTKKKIIEPLLNLLDWDPQGDDVILEYSIRIGSRTVEVDYALAPDRHPLVFIEAKAFDSPLIEDYANQIISYCKVDEVRWAALINGHYIKIYDAKAGRTEKDCIISEIDLTNPFNKILDLELLYRDSVTSGKLNDKIKLLRDKKDAISKLEENQRKLEDDFANSIISVIGETSPESVYRISKELAQKTVDLFRAMVTSKSEPPKLSHGEVNEVSRKELS